MFLMYVLPCVRGVRGMCVCVCVCLPGQATDQKCSRRAFSTMDPICTVTLERDVRTLGSEVCSIRTISNVAHLQLYQVSVLAERGDYEAPLSLPRVCVLVSSSPVSMEAIPTA